MKYLLSQEELDKLQFDQSNRVKTAIHATMERLDHIFTSIEEENLVFTRDLYDRFRLTLNIAVSQQSYVDFFKCWEERTPKCMPVFPKREEPAQEPIDDLPF